MAARGLFFLFYVFFLLGAGLIIPGDLLAQKERIEIDLGEDELDSSVKNAVYRFPEFVKGKVTFRNGKYTYGILNHNLLLDEIMFIDPQQDTLALDEVHKIRSISIGEDTYFYDEKGENLLILLEDYGFSQLLVSEKYELTNIKGQGAFGRDFNSVSPASANRYYLNVGLNSGLKANASYEFKVKSSYYLADRNHRIFPANRKNACKVFSEHKNSVKAYIEENNVDLRKKEDLMALLQYFNGLYKE